MLPRIAFLHTSPVHIGTFTELTDRLSPGTRAAHIVDEDLLRQAREQGHEHPDVVHNVQRAVRAAAAAGARVVACTCSTIGGAAESTPIGHGHVALRIDRAMADQAVRLGPKVLVVAALASTLAPTVNLIEDSARRLALPVEASPLWVCDAWPHFEQGRLTQYLAAIRVAVERECGAVGRWADVIVLAQASMAPVAPALSHSVVPVLSSPELGVRAALAHLSAIQPSD